MQFLSKLIPPFLQRIDHYLLLHYRVLWESRIHYVGFFGGAALLLVSLLGMIYPLSTSYAIPNMMVVFLISAIPAAIGVLFWGYHQYVYSIEREFGKTFRGLTQFRLLLNLAAISIIIAPAIALPSILNYRTGEILSPHELQSDVQILNTGAPFFPANDRYNRESDGFYQALDCAKNNYQSDCFSQYSYVFRRFYASIHCEDTDCTLQEHSAYPPINSNADIVTFVKMDDEQFLSHIEAFLATFEKYGEKLDISAQKVLRNWKQRGQLNSLTLNDQIEAVEAKISLIDNAQRPVRMDQLWNATGILFCFLFALASIANMMKSLTVRELLLSIAAFGGVCVAGALLTALFSSSNLMRGENFFFLYTSVIYGITTIIAYRISSRREYSVLKALSLTLNSFFTPAIILWGVLLIGKLGFLYINLTVESTLLLLISGIVFYSTVLVPRYQNRFKLLRALPKR